MEQQGTMYIQRPPVIPLPRALGRSSAPSLSPELRRAPDLYDTTPTLPLASEAFL